MAKVHLGSAHGWSDRLAKEARYGSLEYGCSFKVYQGQSGGLLESLLRPSPDHVHCWATDARSVEFKSLP